MKKAMFLLLLGLGICLLVPHFSSAGCTNAGFFTRWVLRGTNTVILYDGSIPIVRFDVQTCDLQPTSRISLLKYDICDGDEILIDDSRCTIMSVYPPDLN